MKKTIRCLAGALFCVLAAATAAPAQQATETVRPAKLAIHTHALANGLRIILLEDHAVPIANLQVWYHVGSKNEEAGHTGFAHLFEHLMFKGSAHVGPEEHSRIIEASGGFDNAYTNDDTTVFWETFPANILERVIWLEADRMGSLNVDQANFTSEREVVKEERRLGVENRPYGYVAEDLYAAAFTVHPYHHTTIGSMEDLNKATLADVRAFHDTFYRPDNATLVLVGDFDSSQALAWAEKYFGGIPKPSAPIPRSLPQEPPQTSERIVNKSYPNTPLPAVVEGFKMPAAYTPDYYPLNLAANLLSQGESSRLYRTLVYRDQIAVFSAGFGNFTEDPNLFWAFAVLNQGHTTAEGLKAIEGVLDSLKQEPIGDQELEKSKNQTISGFILGRDTDQEKADAIGAAAVIGKDPELVNTDLARFLAVTAADIQRVAKEYFDRTRATVLLITPAKEEGPPPAKPGEGSR